MTDMPPSKIPDLTCVPLGEIGARTVALIIPGTPLPVAAFNSSL